MVNLSNKSVLIYDMGLFTELAARLARDFGKVYYFVPWEEAFPRAHRALVGHDFDGIERVLNFDEYVDKVDMIYAPDTHSGGRVDYLRRHGYPVFGAGKVEKLEVDRYYARELGKTLGLRTQHTEKVRGLKKLRAYLDAHHNVYVKINIFRGEVESFLAPSRKLVEPLLDEIATEFGPAQEELEFVVEEEVGRVEPGWDGLVLNGEYLSPTTYGYELPPAVYICKVVPYEDIPPSLADVNEKFAPVFKQQKICSHVSTEIRLDSPEEYYVIDWTIRMGAPGPAAVQSELITNYSEVVWAMAHGELPTPIMEPDVVYAATIAFGTDWAEKHWLNVNFPKDMRRWVKFRKAARYDNLYFAVPGMPNVCNVVEFGTSIKTILKNLEKKMKEVEGYGLDKPTINIPSILETIEEGTMMGIDF